MRPACRVLLLVPFVAAMLAAGCGEKLATVSGEVTLDDKPVQQGLITFAAADGKVPPSAVEIKDGKYTLQTTPGAKKVQISSQVVVGEKKAYAEASAPSRPVYQEAIPAKYNTKTELTADVVKGANSHDWKLRSK